jgi:hypothetical protein
MKIRSGFVSNSSSSSFVIAVSPGQKKHKITFEIDFSKYISKYDPKPISTKEQLDEWYRGERDGEVDNVYKNCLKAIESGKIILMGSFGDQTDDPIEEMFCNKGLGHFNLEGVDVIDNEAGY